MSIPFTLICIDTEVGIEQGTEGRFPEDDEIKYIVTRDRDWIGRIKLKE